MPHVVGERLGALDNVRYHKAGKESRAELGLDSAAGRLKRATASSLSCMALSMSSVEILIISLASAAATEAI